MYQVEYAIGAIGNSTGSVAVLCADGVVIAAEKKIASKLLAPPRSSEKMFALDEHVLVAVAGLTADANILLTQGRLVAQRHRYAHGGAAMAVEPLVATLADYKHSYTQYGGLRPFGCAFLYAGWDADRGFQLYQSDPSGNYSGWKATAIGNNATTCVVVRARAREKERARREPCNVYLATPLSRPIVCRAVSTLKTEYKPGCSLEEGKLLAIKVRPRRRENGRMRARRASATAPPPPLLPRAGPLQGAGHGTPDERALGGGRAALCRRRGGVGGGGVGERRVAAARRQARADVPHQRGGRRAHYAGGAARSGGRRRAGRGAGEHLSAAREGRPAPSSRACA